MSRYKNIGASILAYIALNSATIDRVQAQDKKHYYSVGDMLHNIADEGITTAKNGITIGNTTLKFNKKVSENYIKPFSEWLKETKGNEYDDVSKVNVDRHLSTARNLPLYSGNIGSVISPDVLSRIRDEGSLEKRITRINRMNEIVPIQYEIYRQENRHDIITFDYIISLTRGESDFDKKARSGKGANGVMQEINDTWKLYNKLPYNPYVFDPKENTRTGVKYLNDILDYYEDAINDWPKFDDRYKLQLLTAGYNWGPANVVKVVNNRGNIDNMPDDTKEHVANVNRWSFGG
jgi:hypothetical protein